MSFIVAQHYQFPIRDPFKEGHVLTAIEANVLNWHRARLIQKIVLKWVTTAIEEAVVANGGDDTTILSVEEVDALCQRIHDFDAEYELKEAKEPRTSILEYNLELLASNFLYKNGNGEEPSAEDIERIKKVPEIQARARDIIKSGTFSLSELLA